MPNLKEIWLCICVLFYDSFFYKCAKEKNDNLFEDLYFRNGWCDLLQIWYVFFPNTPAPAQWIWSSLVKRSWSYEHA